MSTVFHTWDFIFTVKSETRKVVLQSSLNGDGDGAAKPVFSSRSSLIRQRNICRTNMNIISTQPQIAEGTKDLNRMRFHMLPRNQYWEL